LGDGELHVAVANSRSCILPHLDLKSVKGGVWGDRRELAGTFFKSKRVGAFGLSLCHSNELTMDRLSQQRPRSSR
jgi:hypothetical protein